MPQPDGGPAFPFMANSESYRDRGFRLGSNVGRSLRDWFAGMALQGLLSHPHFMETIERVAKATDTERTRILASGAWAYADAMLAERVTEVPHAGR